MSTCNIELLRDYAFDELPAADRPEFERHLADCGECGSELERLRLTTTALRMLPDREPPQRIAFVSDKIFKPSRFWNLAPWLGFGSAAVMAVALTISVYRRPVEVRTIAAQAPVADIVNKAVAEAQARTHEEDTRLFKAALATMEQKAELKEAKLEAKYDVKYDKDRRALLDTFYVMQAHDKQDLYARNEAPQVGQ